MRQIDKIIIHCTATPTGRTVTVKDVDTWHRQRGFQGIGYHFLIGLKGELWDGRQVETVGAHTLGKNARSIDVCYVGGLDLKGKPIDTRTDAQKRALITLLKSLKSKFPKATIHGHREFAEKACPCFDARNEYKNL